MEQKIGNGTAINNASSSTGSTSTGSTSNSNSNSNTSTSAASTSIAMGGTSNNTNANNVVPPRAGVPVTSILGGSLAGAGSDSEGANSNANIIPVISGSPTEKKDDNTGATDIPNS